MACVICQVQFKLKLHRNSYSDSFPQMRIPTNKSIKLTSSDAAIVQTIYIINSILKRKPPEKELNGFVGEV